MDVWLKNYSALRVIHSILTFCPLLWNLIFLILLFIFFNRNRANVFKQYNLQMNKEQQNLIKDQQNDIIELRKRIEIIKVLEINNN